MCTKLFQPGNFDTWSFHALIRTGGAWQHMKWNLACEVITFIWAMIEDLDAKESHSMM